MLNYYPLASKEACRSPSCFQSCCLRGNFHVAPALIDVLLLLAIIALVVAPQERPIREIRRSKETYLRSRCSTADLLLTVTYNESCVSLTAVPSDCSKRTGHRDVGKLGDRAIQARPATLVALRAVRRGRPPSRPFAREALAL